MNRRPTILDVASHAGVSKSTVSLVLQGSPLVKGETARLVRQSMSDVGYVYNRAAAQLRSASVGLIGMVINDLRNPFFTEFATTLQMALSSSGYATVMANSDEDPELQSRLVRSMIEHGVSALVISPTYGDVAASFDQISRAGLPTLQVLRKVDDRLDQFPFASFDYFDGGVQATRHLIAEGARRIAFIGGTEGRPITEERISGYRHEMTRIGAKPLVLYGRPTRANGAALAEELLRDHPDVDAAICFNDLVSLGMMASFGRLGRTVGAGFRLVGFDDIEESAQVWPALSSVSCDIATFGKETATTLLDWLIRHQKPVAERREPVRLIVRASSTGKT
ncbi:LacI family DNA-binding transcriptional regulator [Paracoccus caeni]|uniref:LacI family DNA-binding transcriptional regulator n=1 Tax=Paracoccus caeni TaxID=657651 RepID=A0A934SDA2_9RHOB|nr:LacI family DNA-binding transcriptional regulator [Paracoccus caeni]MBK4215245.1 LacI family DNA-binding transcriptional regulator [Paracoccus caeni]